MGGTAPPIRSLVPVTRLPRTENARRQPFTGRLRAVVRDGFALSVATFARSRADAAGGEGARFAGPAGSAFMGAAGAAAGAFTPGRGTRNDFRNASNGRVFNTSSLVSPARRAWNTPKRMWSNWPVAC